MHTKIVFCLLFAVSCVLIIPVLHHDLLWRLAFLRNRLWWKDNSNSQSWSWNQSLHRCAFTTVFTLCFIQHCVWSSSWKHVTWLKLEYCLLFEHRSIWSPPLPWPSSASASLFIYGKQKPHVWLYCFNFHPVWPLETTIDKKTLKIDKSEKIIQAE